MASNTDFSLIRSQRIILCNKFLYEGAQWVWAYSGFLTHLWMMTKRKVTTFPCSQEELILYSQVFLNKTGKSWLQSLSLERNIKTSHLLDSIENYIHIPNTNVKEHILNSMVKTRGNINVLLYVYVCPICYVS